MRKRLQQFPPLATGGLRTCQVEAIQNLEASFARNRPRALIQMATGSGKTFTAVSFMYRLLKFAGAKRILFLVDTRNLGVQTLQEIQAYTPPDDNRKFTELYNVQRLGSNVLDANSQVCISTIQRMYSILKGEELDENAEDQSPNEANLDSEKPREVGYNPAVPVEFFDFIVIDECHRSIYNLWKGVLDYFDAFLIGLTATPDNRTFGFFSQNVVSEYSHEDAVADGVNVGYDVYTIETEITRQGSRLVAREYVDLRSRQTRQRRWTQLDEDVTYSGRQLDRDVVNASQIRTVIHTFKDKLRTELFPHRKEVPKTLIFAKNDSHAEDIIKTVREEFGEGNAFCRKITYNAANPEEALASFRTSYHPRIAVTVDMIATGTDVKPLECLLFMRDVKSRNYFEQMKGRGTRTVAYDDLRKVTPSATGNKTHFVIIDAVGVCKSVKTDSRGLERKRSVAMKDLMQQVLLGGRDEDTLLSLANRLTRLEKQLTPEERAEISRLTKGRTINALVHGLLNAHNPDQHADKARKLFGLTDTAPMAEQLSQAKEELIEDACRPFDSAAVRDYLEQTRQQHDQIIDVVNQDRVTFAGADPQAKEKAQQAVKTFQDFLVQHRDEMLALQVFYNQPYHRRTLTYQMIKELAEALQKPPYLLTTERLWTAYSQLEQSRVKGANSRKVLTDIISLVRFASGTDEALLPFGEIVNRKFEGWIAKHEQQGRTFTSEQREWLGLIRDHLTTSVHIEKNDFDHTPFHQRGGLLKVWTLFGEKFEGMLEEINNELVA